MKATDFEYKHETTEAGAAAAQGQKIDLVVHAIDVGSFPGWLADDPAEILAVVTVTSGKESRTWSSLVKRYEFGDRFFDRDASPVFVADDLPLDRKGVQLEVQLREVDNIAPLKKILENIPGLAKLIPAVGSQIGTAAAVASDLLGLLPDDLGRTFFSFKRNFAVKGGTDYSGHAPFLPGLLTITSEPGEKHRKNKKFKGSSVALRIATVA